jgi:pimeloyl-ACP methyl ester carboxylesterase
MLRKLLLIILILVSKDVYAFLVVGGNPTQEYDVRKSWEHAVVHVPGNLLTKSVDSVTVSNPMPVIVFLHGCAGINEQERKWANFLKSQKVIVILLDSYAISNREKNCITATHTTNIGKVPVNDLRPAEAEYAVSKLKDMPWADTKNIFLMGHSEGGAGAFLTKELGLRGVIISGFPCSVRNRRFGSSRDTPTLILNHEIDPFFVRPDVEYKQCSDRPYWKFRTNAVEVILPGSGHGTAEAPLAQEAVSKFLKENIK